MVFMVLLLLKISSFDPFGNGKYSPFLSQKIDGKIIFTDYWKVLVLNFSVMGNTVFFEPRSWWKDDIYWLLRGSCFEVFGDGKYDLFSREKVNGKMIFTWSFLAFNDISGLGKYGFSPSVTTKIKASILWYHLCYHIWHHIFYVSISIILVMNWMS